MNSYYTYNTYNSYNTYLTHKKKATPQGSFK